jgi:hypothetical protein
MGGLKALSGLSIKMEDDSMYDCIREFDLTIVEGREIQQSVY